MKKGKFVDLHQHIMKVHNNFDDQVKHYTSIHNPNPTHLSHAMGALEYKTKKKDYNGDIEADAIKYKAMHKAALNHQKEIDARHRSTYDSYQSYHKHDNADND